MKKKPVCCFCGKECENEYGNNPYPLNTNPEARCCDVCNATKVVPARIVEITKKEEPKKS